MSINQKNANFKRINIVLSLKVDQTIKVNKKDYYRAYHLV